MRWPKSVQAKAKRTCTHRKGEHVGRRQRRLTTSRRGLRREMGTRRSAKLVKDRDALLDLPTTSPRNIGSKSARPTPIVEDVRPTVRHRTEALNKGCLSPQDRLAMQVQTDDVGAEVSEHSKLDRRNRLPEVISGVEVPRTGVRQLLKLPPDHASPTLCAYLWASFGSFLSQLLCRALPRPRQANEETSFRSNSRPGRDGAGASGRW